MKILVINAGSSSLKYQFIDMKNEKVLAKGICERIGIGGNICHSTFDGRKVEESVELINHTEAFKKVQKVLTEGAGAVIDSMKEISAVGHRIVQGGSLFKKSVIIDQKVIEGIESLVPLAPLHNPAHIQGILACMEVLGPDVPEVVVFDTSFHQTMPEHSYMYALPYEYYEKYKIRRYGFHGTSHRYVSSRCAELMGKNIEDLKIITCHLGNGASITAIEGGKVLDTSMGFTPLDGFIMGTRTGSLDPSIVTFLADKENKSGKELSDLFNKKSGMLGISEVSSDNRDVSAAAAEGNKKAALAIKMQKYQITKFIGSYIAALGGVDAVVFTGGIGENTASLREDVIKQFEFMGVKVDLQKNKLTLGGKEDLITTENSKVKVYVIPTNEEIIIARDTKKLVDKLNGQ